MGKHLVKSKHLGIDPWWSPDETDLHIPVHSIARAKRLKQPSARKASDQHRAVPAHEWTAIDCKTPKESF